MRRRLKDELEVPGETVMMKIVSIENIKKRLNEIIDILEGLGYKTPNDVPESKLKNEFRQLLKILNIRSDI